MTLKTDPEQNEVRALRSVADWRRKRVIEIGCGDGRLTLRLARLGASVYACDPDVAAIRAARKTLPQRFARRVEYHVGHAEHLRPAKETFDLAVFAWALC
jgi:2-polyprenyl-3-methyl-5-hydroxy-6-metoxy-1,4-benzoquinol methylase